MAYDQFEKAFAGVGAYVVLKGGEIVINVVFKRPKDGAGSLYAYMHGYGFVMVRGRASGYGYDKHSAAVRDACSKANREWIAPEMIRLIDVLSIDSGRYWYDTLRLAGYTVIQVI